MRLDGQVALVTGAGRGIGRRALALEMDVADSGSVRAGFAAIARRWGPIDVAVTNATVEPPERGRR